MNTKYDIFISYKRKSLPTANNLYYRLTTRGYSTFFDLEEMGRDNFNIQLLNYIENAKDVFVILEEGSLDGCKKENWEKDDWFCHEIAFALEQKKNIIPILIGGYKMPNSDYLPEKLKDLSYKNAPDFNFTFFEAYLDKLIEKDYLISKPNLQEKTTSIFKFYSNENCQIFKEGKLVCSLEGLADEPFYLPVPRKGDYRFKAFNLITNNTKIIKEHIDADEEKDVDIEWENYISLELPGKKVTGSEFLVDLDYAKFNMIRVEGGEMILGATKEQETDAETNEFPTHKIKIGTFYIAQFPITQNIWEIVMGYNNSHFIDKGGKQKASEILVKSISSKIPNISTVNDAIDDFLQDNSAVPSSGIKYYKDKVKNWVTDKVNDFINKESDDIGHYPVENISYDEAVEFTRRLSNITNIKFNLPREEEWEYAARGGQRSKGFKYAGSNNIDEVAWYRDNADGTTHPVGEKKPNELGLYDMSGNVWEWTETPAHSYLSNIEPYGNIFIRRGGSWWHKAKNCRVARRYPSTYSKKTSGLGLRVVIRENIE